ncbi:MAG: bifunctional metallophosphatase/5'-nucleotidase [Myxococcota bacterium]|nr:bifunctional metallophosphatase/5'-nucleotidase [Myxococcota bacterium]
MIGHSSPVADLHFYVDVDDVLAETTRALARLAQERFGKRVRFSEMNVFDLSVSLGLGEEEFPEFMAAAHEREFLLGLAPVSGGARTLVRWREAGAKISVVTGRPPDSRPATLAWLERQGIPFDRLDFVDKYARYSDPKMTTPQQLLDQGYHTIIEDADATALYWAQNTDARVLLYDRPWNQASEAEAHGAIRVHDWAEICEFADPPS